MFKAIIITIAVFLGIGMTAIATKVIFFPVRTLDKVIDTGIGAQDHVLNADNAIYNYEWFKQQYENIEASKKQYVNAKANYEAYVAMLPADRSQWSFEDKTEQARLNTVVLGLQNNLETQIANYNARAKMSTRNIFENSVLPSYIDALTFITK